MSPADPFPWKVGDEVVATSAATIHAGRIAAVAYCDRSDVRTIVIAETGFRVHSMFGRPDSWTSSTYAIEVDHRGVPTSPLVRLVTAAERRAWLAGGPSPAAYRRKEVRRG